MRWRSVKTCLLREPITVEYLKLDIYGQVNGP